MKHAIEITDAGMANTVQDAGRTGHRSIGVPVSGAADALWLACANRLVGNAADAAAIEIPLAGPSLRATDGPVRAVLVGAVDAQLLRTDGQVQRLAAGHTVTLRKGDVLRVGVVRAGVAYLALAGACQVPCQLGSRSTYARARLGGVAGRALTVGDRIECGEPPSHAGLEWRASVFEHGDGPIRVMLGPQDDAFAPHTIATFLREPYRVGRQSDRMGMRLEGATLTHRSGADITSEGVVPGAIQVPGNGAPIVLLIDAQTVGGYAKIATVIRADLPRLAQLRPGAELRFAAVTRAEAHATRQRQTEALARWTASIETYRPPGTVDLAALVESNIVSGMIDARNELMPWER
ncbi:MAG: biotin-dependent carboxyltransferase family protein [Burkholderiaceae bacterium]